MARRAASLKKLVETQEVTGVSDIDRAIDDLLALVQAMLPGARRALCDGDAATVGDRKDLDDLRSAVAGLDTLMSDSPTFHLMRDGDQVGRLNRVGGKRTPCAAFMGAGRSLLARLRKVCL